MLPGPGATQLGISIGHAKAGLAGGVVAGVCFILPAFPIMLALAAAYVAFGTLPSMRHAFYGIGPVVVGIFGVSVFSLSQSRYCRYRHAARHLMECASLASSIPDFARFETHEAYATRLRGEHGRKSLFWSLIS
jgi:chromate transport protein ChrA